MVVIDKEKDERLRKKEEKQEQWIKNMIRKKVVVNTIKKAATMSRERFCKQVVEVLVMDRAWSRLE